MKFIVSSDRNEIMWWENWKKKSRR
jgi:hypothetical protein